jgi:AGCS family alanine or glycine:cation symporter
MNVVAFFYWLNESILSLPIVIVFFSVGIILTLLTRFAQVRAFPKFLSLITGGLSEEALAKSGLKETKDVNSLSSFHALFAAIATTMGMGNIVGPSMAIMVGGPGALFWLLVYIVLGSVIKFAEVTFAVSTRVKTAEGKIIGGPMQYLKEVSPLIAHWYNGAIIVLLMSWSSLQSNTLANILVQEHIPAWFTGLALAVLTFVVLRGGAQRFGTLASALVPVMFVLYITSALFILLRDIDALRSAIMLVFSSITTRAAAVGGFAGASVFQAMRIGVLRGILMTEAGVGTAAIPHSLADTNKPSDQGVLAMCSMVSDAMLSMISGLLALVTGLWMQGEFRSTLVYEVFLMNLPFWGRYILVISVVLFVLTTVIGNSFNGMQSFNVLTRYRWVNGYIATIVAIVFCGALVSAPLVWEIADTIMVFVAIPNLIGLVILAHRHYKVLKI